ncbi:response regulator transcription factor [Vallitalea guaymasensis]|uniref:response regulator transcription factor n=1 Tax=Vallitalea guaymasensis TaxID=1185412 RepID=UPI002355E36F|nr:response regulator transcription factor [Vallitalea guaymasensis]
MYNVLLVDDEPFIVDGLEVLIDWAKLNLTVVGKAYNGKDALDFMKFTHVDILITDVKMPKMQGLELISEAKILNPNCKCLILSGYNDFEYVKEGIKLGIENYLTKPVNTDELTATLEETVKSLDLATSKVIFTPDNSEWHILRGNILSRWVNDSITSEELRNRADMLQIITDSSCYSVAIINITLDSNVNSQVSKIYNICYNYIKSDGKIMSFEDMYGNFVLIFTHEQYDDRDSYILNILGRIYDNITSLNVKVHITLGPTVISYKELSKSYKTARKLFEYFLIYPNKKVICNDLIDDSKLKVENLISIDHNFIASSLVSKNKEELFDYIDKLFDEVINIPGITPEHLKMIVVKILLTLYKSMSSQFVLFQNEIINHQSNLLSTIHNIHDLKILKETLKDLFTYIIDKLNEKETSTSPVVYQVLKYIHKNYSKELSLKTLSFQFNINTTYLGQLFKKETGISFPNYLNNYRIDRAKEYLLESNLKTAQIAKKVGYMDPNYFYRIFKKYTGVSPTDYKSLK